nr:hypothetical protein [Tanacetum cinerariifolium]
MVAILEKSEHNVDFHLIVDFVEASPLRIETTEEGTKILATVDGILRTVTESSLRRNLKLQDEEGINQDRANIAKSSTLAHDSAPRVTSPDADEERSRDDAPIKGRNLDEGEAASERFSDYIEEMATNGCITVLASGVTEVPTGSGSIPTAGPPTTEVPTGSDVVPTAGPMFATATVLKEEMERDGQITSERIAKDAEVTRIHAEEELQMMINNLDRSNETVLKYLQEYKQFAEDLSIGERVELINDLIKYQENYAQILKYQTQQRKPWSKKQKRDYYMAIIRSNLGWKVKDFRGMTFEEIKAKFTTVWKQIKNFIPMGSKEEAERFKRKGIMFEQESVKKLKTSESVPEEKNLMHALVEWKLYDICRVHHVTAKDKEIFMLVEKDYPLRKGLAIGMISYKLQVENYSKMANDLILKIYKIASSPRQQVIEFPLPEEVSTASKESCHCQKKREATAVKIALLLKSKRNSFTEAGGAVACNCLRIAVIAVVTTLVR